MDEDGLIKKIIEHFGKLMSQYTMDKLIFGDAFIEFTDRKIEVVEHDKVICDKGGWKVVLDTIDKQKVREIALKHTWIDKEGCCTTEANPDSQSFPELDETIDKENFFKELGLE